MWDSRATKGLSAAVRGRAPLAGAGCDGPGRRPLDQRCLTEPVRKPLLQSLFRQRLLRFWNNENRPQSGRPANPYQRDAVPHGRASEAISRIVGLNLKGG